MIRCQKLVRKFRKAKRKKEGNRQQKRIREKDKMKTLTIQSQNK